MVGLQIHYSILGTVAGLCVWSIYRFTLRGSEWEKDYWPLLMIPIICLMISGYGVVFPEKFIGETQGKEWRATK